MGTRVDNVKVDKKILRKVGYKVQDLELKVNVLTYKMQYGTWPLPHQIYSLNPRKLQKIRMTLSNPVDRKNWIKHVLLSPTQSDTYVPCSNVHNPSVAKLSDFFDMKHKRVASPHIQRGKLSTDCSSIETSKSTSDQFVNVCPRRPSFRPRNVSTEESDLSKSGDFTLQRRNNEQFLVNECNRRSSRVLSVQNNKSVASNAKLNPCQDFTNTVHRCRSFLKELEDNDKRLRLLNHSSERRVSSSKDTYATEQPASLTAEKREVSEAAGETRKDKQSKKRQAKTRKARKDETKCATRMKGNEPSAKDVDQVHQQSDINASSNAMMINDVAFPKQLQDLLMNHSRHSVRPSLDTLYQVRRRLQSLHNVLRMYEDSKSLEKRKLADQVGEVNVLASVVPKIEEMGENKIDANHDSDSRKALSCVQCSIVDSCEYFEMDHTEESSSSFAECSSNTSSKTYQYSSDVALRSICSKEYDQRSVRRSACTSDLAALVSSCNQFPPFYSAMSHVSEYRESQSERNTREQDISDHSHELKSNSRADENATNASFNLRKKKFAPVSENTRCILSSRDIPIEKDSASSMKETIIEEISDAFDGEHYQGNTMIISRGSSRSKISMRSDQEKKSTALLLQEALLFKQALLTRVESEKKCLMHSTGENNVAGELPTHYETQIENGNNFPTMVMDIETEGPIIDTIHAQLNRRYVRLEMKQRSDLFPRGLRDIIALARCESEGDADNEELVRETPSEYFSFCNLAVSDNEDIESNAPLSLKPPIYEKVISIMIPVDMENKDAESSRQNSREDVNVGDLDGDIVGKHLPVMLELEDLVLERVKNIRDYMDIFLHSQDRAISKTRRVLQGPNESVSSRCSDKASHMILHDQFAVSSKYDSIERVATDSSKHHKLESSKDGILKSRRRVSTGKSIGTNTVMPSKLSSDIECPKSKTLVDLNLMLGRSSRDCSTDTKTKKSDDVTYDLGECPLFSSLKEEMLNNGLLNNIRRHDPEVSVNVTNLSPRIKHHSTRRLHRTNSRVKAKSDMSLITGIIKNSNVSLHPKRSHSSLTYRNTLKRIRRILYQSDNKSHDYTDECAKCESESRSATSSKSLLLPQGISTRSCIPILRNRLEAARMRHQSNTRSPTRSPLTMLWRENTCTKNRTTSEEATRRRYSVPINKGLYAEETALNLNKINTKKNGDEIAEELEETNATYRDSNVTITNSSNILSDNRNTESLKIDKELTNKEFTCDGKSNTITERIESTAPTLTIISIMASDDSRKNYPAHSFILNTENVRSVTDLLKHKTELWSVAVEKKEQEVNAKPSITDTCTSMTDILEVDQCNLSCLSQIYL
ncbi:uncharacterized protein LOC116847142 isoform X2 [Odontomachus brunneus]|uniref:uncharacterized protein LOC116847142 isoform X2 n=1 Tax=Odontomachus brunneus TaxID=486640 RepID=UPI0013F2205C|nr:uncharacterized protein LOC116847142 isoform X2 [Odontomachus brunneus]